MDKNSGFTHSGSSPQTQDTFVCSGSSPHDIPAVPLRRKESKRERDRRLDYQRRYAVKVWHPQPSNLPLFHLTAEERTHVRKRLSPWLANLKHANGTHAIGIRGGACWEIAQGSVMTAKDPGVKYVEGVWTRPWQLDDGEPPAPHAWATVDGHRVDLVCEFYKFNLQRRHRCNDRQTCRAGCIKPWLASTGKAERIARPAARTPA